MRHHARINHQVTGASGGILVTNHMPYQVATPLVQKPQEFALPKFTPGSSDRSAIGSSADANKGACQ